MFNLLIDIVLKRILKERAKEATPKTGPIDFQDFVGLPGVSPMLNWLSGSVEARRLDPNATITPPPFWDEAQETAGVTKQPLLCGMEITEIVMFLPDFVNAAMESARHNLHSTLEEDARYLGRQARKLRIVVEEDVEQHSALTLEAAAKLAQSIAADAFALMFKAHAIAIDPEQYQEWSQTMLFGMLRKDPCEEWPEAMNGVMNEAAEAEMGAFVDPQSFMFSPNTWLAIHQTLEANELPIIPPRMIQWNPKALFLEAYLPQQVGPNQWRVGASYHPTFSGALICALSDMILSEKNALRIHLDALIEKGSTTFIPDPQP